MARITTTTAENSQNQFLTNFESLGPIKEIDDLNLNITYIAKYPIKNTLNLNESSKIETFRPNENENENDDRSISYSPHQRNKQKNYSLNNIKMDSIAQNLNEISFKKDGNRDIFENAGDKNSFLESQITMNSTLVLDCHIEDFANSASKKKEKSDLNSIIENGFFIPNITYNISDSNNEISQSNAKINNVNKNSKDYHIIEYYPSPEKKSNVNENDTSKQEKHTILPELLSYEMSYPVDNSVTPQNRFNGNLMPIPNFDNAKNIFPKIKQTNEIDDESFDDQKDIKFYDSKSKRNERNSFNG